MSGIVGIINLNGEPLDESLLWGMTRSLTPRGPDAQEIWTGGAVGFGHSMLRTTPESAGERQPMTLDGTTWIVADCRVDARQALRQELAAQGQVTGEDTPDCELILRAYSAWGRSCVDHLLGDFAFGIWDGRTRSVFGARDHFGVKAFFYAHVGSTVVFSNALNCVRRHPSVGNDLDELGIADFLVYGYALDLDRTAFSAIHRLAPSHTLTVSADNASVRRYWQMPLEDEIRYRKRDTYVEHFVELLDTAVRDRLRTSTAAIFMSGGLDSPTIAATAKRLLASTLPSHRLEAHTAVFDRIAPDEERKYSQLAADSIGIPIRHFPLDDYTFPPRDTDPEGYPPEPGSVFDRGRVVDIYRGPAESSRVLLRGDGADPLIDALPPDALQTHLRLPRAGRLVTDFVWLMRTRRQVPRFGIRTALRKAVGQTPPQVVQPFPDWLVPTLESRLELKARWRAENDTLPLKPGFELAHAYWPHQFEGHDPGSMDLAAETRFPFVDVRMARYLLRLPAIPWTVEKSLLRVAMRNVLPRQLLRRPKAGLAGNPWAHLVPPAGTAWWEPYLVPAEGLERFVDVAAATRTVARIVGDVQSGCGREGIDSLRVCLRPIGLNLWLRQIVCARLQHAQ